MFLGMSIQKTNKSLYNVIIISNNNIYLHTFSPIPPPAHHASARPLLTTHATHPLPAHMQPTAVYGYLSPAKTHHQYQPLWFTE